MNPAPVGGLILGWICEQFDVRVGLLVGGIGVLMAAVEAALMLCRTL